MKVVMTLLYNTDVNDKNKKSESNNLYWRKFFDLYSTGYSLSHMNKKQHLSIPHSFTLLLRPHSARPFSILHVSIFELSSRPNSYPDVSE